MQTFLLKLGCLCLFAFIFFSAYHSNTAPSSANTVKLPTLPSAVLVSTHSALNKDASEVKAAAEQLTKPILPVIKFN